MSREMTWRNQCLGRLPGGGKSKLIPTVLSTEGERMKSKFLGRGISVCKMPEVGKQGFCAGGDIGELSRSVHIGLHVALGLTEYFKLGEEHKYTCFVKWSFMLLYRELKTRGGTHYETVVIGQARSE